MPHETNVAAVDGVGRRAGECRSGAQPFVLSAAQAQRQLLWRTAFLRIARAISAGNQVIQLLGPEHRARWAEHVADLAAALIDDIGNPANAVHAAIAAIVARAGAIAAIRIFVGKRLQGDAELPQVVFALRVAGCFAGQRERWQQQGDENADDRNDHQQLDQRETSLLHESDSRIETKRCEPATRLRTNDAYRIRRDAGRRSCVHGMQRSGRNIVRPSTNDHSR